MTSGRQAVKIVFMNDGSPIADLESDQKAPEQAESGSGNWLSENVFKPAANAGVVEPYNAVANVLNAGAIPDWAPRLDHLQVAPAKLGTPEWFAQTASSGVAMIAPYTAAGKLAGVSMRSAGARLGLEGKLASVLKNDQVAMVAGAAAFDYSRDTRPGETREFNALAGGAAFGIFGVGNSLSRSLSLGYRLPALAGTGVAGGLAQSTVARIPSGELPSKDELANAGAASAMMNIFLPYAQMGMARAGSAVNQRIGRGDLHDKYAQQKFGDEIKEGENSDTASDGGRLARAYKDLAAKADPWMRVVESKNDTSYANNKINLGEGQRSLDKLVHELDHHVKDDRTSTYEPQFLEAKRLLAEGNIAEAQNIYESTRQEQEHSALIAERGADAVASPDAIASMQATENKTYRDLWREEFKQFEESSGEYRPERQFAGRNEKIARLSDAEWAAVQERFADLDTAEKIKAITAIRTANESVQQNLIRQAVRDDNPAVQINALEHFEILPPRMRVDVFNERLQSPNSSTRLAVVNKLEALPASERADAFRKLLTDSATIKMDRSGSLEVWRLQDEIPALVWNRLYRQSSAIILLEQLSSIPASKRNDLWDIAYQQKSTRDAAMANIHRLRPDEQSQAWSRAWQDGLPVLRREYAPEPLLKVIPKLSPAARDEALHKIFVSNARLVGLDAAIESLPENQRYPYWQKMFDRTTEKWSEEANKYELDHTLDKIAEERFGRKQRTGSIEDRTKFSEIASSSKHEDLEARQNFELQLVNVDRDLGETIRALPESVRSEAWWKLAEQNNPSLYVQGLKRSVKSLPENERLDAVKELLRLADSPLSRQLVVSGSNRFGTVEASLGGYRFYPMHEIPQRQLPELMEAVLNVQNSNVRKGALQNFPMANGFDDAPLNRTLDVFEKTFNTLHKFGRDEDVEAFKQIWDEMPEPDFDYTPGQSIAMPVEHGLVERLHPDILARIMFGKDYSKTVASFADQYPDAVRQMVQHSTSWLSDEVRTARAAQLLRLISAHQDGQPLSALVAETLKVPDLTPEHDGDVPKWDGAPAAAIVEALAKSAPASERRQGMNDAIKALSSTENPSTINAVAHLAKALGRVDSDIYTGEFLPAAHALMSDRAVPYSQRMMVARELASLQREDVFEPGELKIPSMRMAPVDVEPAKAAELREDLIAGLRGEKDLNKLLGNGSLGKLFPDLFGHYETDGGILGRPQHNGHELVLDAHIMLVVKNMRENPLFEKLSPRQQEDLLMAGLMHDVGKRANIIDPDHEWASSNMTWGVLESLGYEPVRIGRIADLVARHSEVGYSPDNLASKRFKENPEALDDLSAHYLHPAATNQLRIFNESDSRALDQAGSYWTQEVKAELDRVRNLMQSKSKEMSRYSIPLLTTELPNRFGIYSAQDYAVLGHASPHLESAFLEQLALIESPDYSISTSLFTPSHQRAYDSQSQIFALLAARPERISQAYRYNLGTGMGVDWQGHVNLLKRWTDQAEGELFASELENKLAEAGIEGTGSEGGRLARLRNGLQDFTSLDDVTGTLGADHPMTKGARVLIDALTHTSDGKPLKKHNEIKVNNATITGFGIKRSGQPIAFADANADTLPALYSGQPKPYYLADNQNSSQALHIPAQIWRRAQELNKPFFVLDP